MTDIKPPNWGSCKDINLKEDIKSDLQEISDIGANEGIKQMAQKIIQLEDYEYLGQVRAEL